MQTPSNRTESRRRLRRRRRAGMTIVEIMIVMTIIALIAGAASVALLPSLKRAKVKQTSADAKTIASAAEMYLADNDDCPTVDELVATKMLKKGANTMDAWDHDFSVECDEDGAIVRSAGPDEQMGTEDDIQ